VLKSTESSKSGYDILILSDLLHFFDSHDVLVSTIESLLSKGSNARVYVGVGLCISQFPGADLMHRRPENTHTPMFARTSFKKGSLQVFYSTK